MRLFIAIELEPNIKNALLEIQGNMKKAGVTGNCAISAKQICKPATQPWFCFAERVLHFVTHYTYS